MDLKQFRRNNMFYEYAEVGSPNSVNIYLNGYYLGTAIKRKNTFELRVTKTDTTFKGCSVEKVCTKLNSFLQQSFNFRKRNFPNLKFPNKLKIETKHLPIQSFLKEKPNIDLIKPDLAVLNDYDSNKINLTVDFQHNIRLKIPKKYDPVKDKLIIFAEKVKEEILKRKVNHSMRGSIGIIEDNSIKVQMRTEDKRIKFFFTEENGILTVKEFWNRIQNDYQI
jgi:hypothetical protein